MGNIGGVQREHTNSEGFAKKVGLFEAKVLTINPSIEEYKELLGIELKEDSKSAEYLGTSTDGNTFLKIDVWLQAVKSDDRFRVTFFLEDKEREKKDSTKKQYINEVGTCSWSEDPNDLPQWFSEREYRVAFVGEEALYNFLKTWLSELDYRKAETTLQIEWKKLMKGNVKDLRDQIDGEWCSNLVALATIKVKEGETKEGETKEYQTVYNKAFLPSYCLKNFRLIDYMNPKVLDGIKAKKSKDQKVHEKFVLNILGQYGCKDYFILRELKNYDPKENLVASDKVITEEDSDY